MIVEEEEFRHEIRRAFECGVEQAKASFAADLRQLADDMVEQIFQLRQEVRKALGLPPLAGPDDRDATLQ
ncbi:MAG: hypothetical protein WAK69_20710 [Rhodoplanes sp.]